jgi:hypothetical protein
MPTHGPDGSTLLPLEDEKHGFCFDVRGKFRRALLLSGDEGVVGDADADLQLVAIQLVDAQHGFFAVLERAKVDGFPLRGRIEFEGEPLSLEADRGLP